MSVKHEHLWLWPWQKTKRCLWCGSFNELSAGDNTITLSPSGGGDVIRWSNSKSPSAKGDLGMDRSTGKAMIYDGASAVSLISASDVTGNTTENEYSQTTSATTTTSAAYTNIIDTSINLTEDANLWAIATFEASSSGDVAFAGYRITINSVASRDYQQYVVVTNAQTGAIQYRSTAAISAGVISVTFDHKRISGAGTVSTGEAALMIMAVG